MPQNIQNEGPLRKNLPSEPAPTAKPDYLKYIENMGKVLTLVSTLGLIIGCWMAFVYLKNIDFISVFPDVIKDPSSLITVIVVIGFLVLLFGMSFFSPYLLLPSYLSSVKDYTIREFFREKTLFIILIIITVLCFAILSILAFIKWGWITKTLTFIIFLLPPPIAIIRLLLIWHEKQQKQNNQIKQKSFIQVFIEFAPFILYIFFIHLTIFLTLLLLLQLLIDGVHNKIWQYGLLIGYCVLLTINNWFISDYLSSYPESKNNAIVIVPFFIIIPLLVGVTFAAPNFPSHVFTPIRFTEKPDNSSWYLLHNNFQKNDGTQEVSGIEKADLLRLKEKFQCPKEQEEKQKCSNLPYHRNNALYGYMAWNLGNTKVFCPASVHNDKNAECKHENEDEKCDEKEQNEANKTAFSQCLVIDGKFLQIMNEQYIGMPKKENSVSGENLQTERTISNLPFDMKIRQ